MSLQPDFPYELESEEYWEQVDFMADRPGFASGYSRPIFEEFSLERPTCEYEVEHDGDCICQLT